MSSSGTGSTSTSQPPPTPNTWRIKVYTLQSSTNGTLYATEENSVFVNIARETGQMAALTLISKAAKVPWEDLVVYKRMGGVYVFADLVAEAPWIHAEYLPKEGALSFELKAFVYNRKNLSFVDMTE